jgi:hypothetical protein
MTCEWAGCSARGTHLVRIQFPGSMLERWWVCRAHDASLKFQAISSRPPKPEPPQPAAVPAPVHCGSCDRLLDETSDLPVAQRRPCPGCQSLLRLVKVSAADTMEMHDAAQVRSWRAGKGAWIQTLKAGDDYSRLLKAWGQRELQLDRENNRYREQIVLYDGTTIESTAKLTDHR